MERTIVKMLELTSMDVNENQYEINRYLERLQNDGYSIKDVKIATLCRHPLINVCVVTVSKGSNT